MQGYVTLDTRDLPRAAEFYERIARELGSRRSLESDGCVAWGVPGAPAAISVEAPRNGRVAACGTEVVALQAADPEQVQRLYDLALAQGGLERGGARRAWRLLCGLLPRPGWQPSQRLLRNAALGPSACRSIRLAVRFSRLY